MATQMRQGELIQHGRRRLGLRLALGLLILAALAVPLLLVIFAVWRAADADRQTAGEALLSNARILAASYESVLDSSALILRGIATTSDPSLRQVVVPIVGSHLTGLLSQTPRLDLAPAPLGPRSWTVSNLLDIGPEGQPRLAMTVRVDPDAPRPHLVTMVSEPALLAERLDLAQRYPGPVVVAIVDGNGRVIARSRNQDRFVGQRVPAWDTLQSMGTASGLFPARLLEGGDTTFAFKRLDGTPGWVAVIGEATNAFEARWREPVLLLVITSILAVAGALVLAMRLADFIVRPVSSLVDHARRIAAGETPAPPPPSPIVEFEALRLSQLSSHASLLDQIASERRTAAELEISRRRYLAIVEAGALVTLRLDRDGHLIGIDGWERLTGQPAEDALGSGWLERIDPADHELLRHLWSAADDGLSPMECELRLLLPEGRSLWTRLRAVRIADDDGRTVEWVGTLEDIDAARQRQEKLSHLALHDVLTGLPNRLALHEHLGAILSGPRSEQTGALFFIDLDYFKNVNDLHGHAAGDTVLSMVGARLRGLVGPGDIAGRLGGDEFAVILVDAGTREAIEAVARRMIRALRRPYDFGGHRIAIGASIGVAMFTPGVGSVAALFEQADRALYLAKREGRNRMSMAPPAAAQPMDRKAV